MAGIAGISYSVDDSGTASNTFSKWGSTFRSICGSFLLGLRGVAIGGPWRLVGLVAGGSGKPNVLPGPMVCVSTAAWWRGVPNAFSC